MKYIVCTSNTIDEFIERVNGKIKNGYKPVGGMVTGCFHAGPVSSSEYYQAMIKEENQWYTR